MSPQLSSTEATRMWAPFIDVLAEHHFDAQANLPSCRCGARVHSRHGLARHQLAQLIFAGALPTQSVTEWAVIAPDREEPAPMTFADALRECNRPGSTHRIACRTSFPPGPGSRTSRTPSRTHLPDYGERQTRPRQEYRISGPPSAPTPDELPGPGLGLQKRRNR